MRSSPTVPTIDLASWWSGGRDARDDVARRVDHAARTLGCMQIVGHRIAPGAIAGLTRSLDRFFALPRETKQRYTAAPHLERGYRAPSSARAHLFEAFDVGTTAGDFAHLDLDPIVYADNIWPDSAPSFEADVAAWFRAVASLSSTVESMFAAALGLPGSFFEPYTNHSIDLLRMHNFVVEPGTPLAPDQLGTDARTDPGIVTITWADPVVGHEVLDPHGEWRSVVPAPGVLLVTVGDLLARWTNDRWVSGVHRVVPPLDANGRALRRRSAAFLRDGNADAVISTLAPCRDADGRSAYADVTVAEHRRGRPIDECVGPTAA